jgi:hypothetical protein
MRSRKWEFRWELTLTSKRPVEVAPSNRPALLGISGAGEGTRTLDVHLGKFIWSTSIRAVMTCSPTGNVR